MPAGHRALPWGAHSFKERLDRYALAAGVVQWIRGDLEGGKISSSGGFRSGQGFLEKAQCLQRSRPLSGGSRRQEGAPGRGQPLQRCSNEAGLLGRVAGG